MSSGQPGVLLVHAHPDDETITNGVTMAACVAAGARVTLVTCTLGEEGEIIPDSLGHLAADREDALGGYRAEELATAMAALGVTDHRLLGGPGRYRDSGMMGLAGNDRPESFWRADLDEAADTLAEIVVETRPDVLITYDPEGGYGHPDHIQAHRVAMRAVQRAGDRHRVARVLWNCLPAAEAEARLERLRADGPGRFPDVAEVGDLPGVTDEASVAVSVRGTAAAYAAKQAAMAAHATQIEVAGETFALSNGLAQPLWETEYFRLGAGQPPPPGARDDIFAGLTGGASR
ncbi:N-acetyl-1-D-myo-inositol-2-amino-2-deoxy-alpha-D-glucopyranoside deacetylase [Streptomyces profundus]|uniref:N-acetyl-1-D-myo-inositol-2-amino-2-deoxy-alpha- D-glucopyranoside deacetylase n=1 Tax=Streptomyces profundus TaxID=2867410 RepID=UPI001D15FF4D|nr:N-acetyl-1-D-myo-inositol-2-amino-2-deoxy-alpha-D-glucopyranoside deacetylase [Streptomyces sp. MA3_2.13]UED84351.1 N-acetyl-1-D-myo-inositol-2-amino-2-deoxy-alpha-D-glucopyranoside deacetylase [Streptomyces sp. MA3_2.13]